MSVALFAGVAVAGVVVGIFAALFGVGGGLLMVPFIVLVLDEGQHVAEGTSLLVMIATALVGAIAHTRRGYVDWKGAGVIGVAGIAGAVVGALVALEMSGEALRRAFGVVLVIVGLRLILASRSERDPTITS
jgi:uncharacterized membrane protein YfcA